MDITKKIMRTITSMITHILTNTMTIHMNITDLTMGTAMITIMTMDIATTTDILTQATLSLLGCSISLCHMRTAINKLPLTPLLPQIAACGH
jgi:hypothetical protein